MHCARFASPGSQPQRSDRSCELILAHVQHVAERAAGVGHTRGCVDVHARLEEPLVDVGEGSARNAERDRAARDPRLPIPERVVEPLATPAGVEKVSRCSQRTDRGATAQTARAAPASHRPASRSRPRTSTARPTIRRRRTASSERRHPDLAEELVLACEICKPGLDSQLGIGRARAHPLRASSSRSARSSWRICPAPVVPNDREVGRWRGHLFREGSATSGPLERALCGGSSSRRFRPRRKGVRGRL